MSRKFAKTRSTKAQRDFVALSESQPTPSTLIVSSLRSFLQEAKSFGRDLQAVPQHSSTVSMGWHITPGQWSTCVSPYIIASWIISRALSDLQDHGRAMHSLKHKEVAH